MAHATETSMAVYNLDLLPQDDISENRKEGEDSWEGRFSVNDKERYMVNLEAICEIPHTCSAFIGVRNDDYFMATIDELGG